MPSLKHVVLLDNIDLSARDILAKNGVKVSAYQKFAEIPCEELATVDGLIVRSATKVTPEVMSQCPNLTIIGRAGTGVDNIDVKEATSKGVIVMNTPGGNTISAAEHTCFMIVALARNAANNNCIMKSHKWVKGSGNELLGKTLGIIGLGRIGCEVASRMQSFGMTTIGFDPIVGTDSVAKLGIEWVELDKLWSRCDYITVHTPLIPQTKDLVCAKTLAQCKKGIKIINVARGGIVSESDLLEALNSGKCGGAGLDVFVEEPVKNWELIDHPNVVATAHLGASTKEAQLKCGQEIAQQFVDFVKGSSSLVGVLNSPGLVASLSPENSAWLKLGKFVGQLATVAAGKLVSGKLKISIKGDRYPDGLKRFIAPAVLCGVLRKYENNVNLTNSTGLAQKQGIEVEISLEKGVGDLPTEITLTPPTGISVSGQVSGDTAYVTRVNNAKFVSWFSLECLSDHAIYAKLTPKEWADVAGELTSLSLSSINLTEAVDGHFWVVGTCGKNGQGVSKLISVFEI